MKRHPFLKRVLLRLARTFHPILTVPYRGRRLTIDTRDLWIGGEIFYSGTWQPLLTNLIPKLGIAGKVAIDVGANVGTFTMVLSDAVGPDGRVLAIEPGPYVFEILERNVARLASNVTTVRSAAGSSIGEAILHTPSNHLGDARLNFHEPCSRCSRVATTTIDALTERFEDGAVALMKIDVQGYEPAVIAGARETLRRNPDLILIVEIYSAETRALVSELWNDGWRGREVTEDAVTVFANRVPECDWWDLVLTRSESVRARLDRAFSAR